MRVSADSWPWVWARGEPQKDPIHVPWRATWTRCLCSQSCAPNSSRTNNLYAPCPLALSPPGNPQQNCVQCGVRGRRAATAPGNNLNMTKSSANLLTNNRSPAKNIVNRDPKEIKRNSIRNQQESCEHRSEIHYKALGILRKPTWNMLEIDRDAADTDRKPVGNQQEPHRNEEESTRNQ